MKQSIGKGVSEQKQLPLVFAPATRFQITIRKAKTNAHFDCSQSGEIAGPALKAEGPLFPCALTGTPASCRQSEGNACAIRPVIQCRRESPALSGLEQFFTLLAVAGLFLVTSLCAQAEGAPVNSSELFQVTN